MKPLSALDASFIYLESHRSPMHIGSVYLIDASTAPQGFAYPHFRAHIRDRLKCSDIFRQRLVEVPMNLSHPWWINDPDFDLEAHVPHHSVPAPGGMTQLMELASRIFSRTLDRSRPLWELIFVDGLDHVAGLAPGSFAMISRVHHAAIDGGSGAELMGALLDPTPVPRELDFEDAWQAEQVPSAKSMIARAYGQLGRKSLEFGKFAGEVARGIARVNGAKQVETLEPPPRPLTAPRSPFNAPVTSRRSFWGVDFEFSRIRSIRHDNPGTTVNDVMLAICSGGLRDYLQQRSELPERPMVAMAPISVRDKSRQGEGGNQVSAMLVSLATDVDDPLKRLHQIRRNTHSSKIHASALPANRITEFIPSETAALATRLYTRTRLGGRHRPFFNLVITNVPGPPIPLYLAGAQVTQHFGMAPVMDGLGLTIVIFSYAGRVSIGLLACRDIIPDPKHLGDCLLKSLEQLESAVSLEPDKEIVAPARQAGGAAVANVTGGQETLAEFRRASSALKDALDSLEGIEDS